MRWILLITLSLVPGVAHAQKVAAAREAAEYVARKFSKDAAKIGTAKLATRIETLAAMHGDDLFTAVKRVGPQALHAAEQGGSQAVKLLARYGDDALRLAARPQAMSLIAKHGGDTCATALIRHGQVAEPLIEAMGKPAVNALASVSSQNGRRLAMLAEEVGGKLPPTLLDVIGKHGDRAAAWCWSNKGVLAGGALLTSFCLNPEPYLSAAEGVTKPLAEAPGKVAVKIAEGVNWTLLFLGAGGIVGGLIGLRWFLKR